MSSNEQRDPVMPEIGTSIIHPEEGEFKILKNLASGPFSDVYKVLHVLSNECYAMKVEREEGTIRPVLKLDVYVLKEMVESSDAVGFPKLVCAGRTGYYKYVIMQLVGEDLGKLRRAMPDKHFTPSTALLVAIQTLQRIETLHDHGWLCRDVKASNFAIGRDDDSGTIFMLDFGFARRFKDAKGNLLRPRNTAALLGTILYAPIATHYNREQCRKDDLESWLYMIIELFGGSLPWSYLDPVHQHKIIAEAKRFARTGGRYKLFEKCPKEFDEIMELIDNTEFYQRPSYYQMRSLLEEAVDRLQIDRDCLLDWQTNGDRLIRSVSSVCDLGESNLISASMKSSQVEDVPLDDDVPPLSGSFATPVSDDNLSV